jgi:hypothetical protein
LLKTNAEKLREQGATEDKSLEEKATINKNREARQQRKKELDDST